MLIEYQLRVEAQEEVIKNFESYGIEKNRSLVAAIEQGEYR